jgi:hypothetical protein
MKLTWLITEPNKKHYDVTEELNNTDLSDRAIGILAASYVQMHLAEAMKRRSIHVTNLPLPNSAAAKKERDIFERMFGSGEGSLTFGQTIDLACAMGIISPNTHHDLTMIRKVRNKLAHLWESIDFDTTDPNIKSWCDSLKIPQVMAAGHTGRLAETAREKYLVSCNAICKCVFTETVAKKNLVKHSDKYNFFCGVLSQDQQREVARKISRVIFANKTAYADLDDITRAIDDLENNRDISPPKSGAWKNMDAGTIKNGWAREKQDLLVPEVDDDKAKLPLPVPWD